MLEKRAAQLPAPIQMCDGLDRNLPKEHATVSANCLTHGKRWAKLTLFLREPGAPLDNNIVERALKRAILHRKNALFYQTRNGARVGDIFMSLIYTAELNGANPFDYLTELQRHEDELRQSPRDWMPWNYRATLAETGSPDSAPI